MICTRTRVQRRKVSPRSLFRISNICFPRSERRVNFSLSSPTLLHSTALSAVCPVQFSPTRCVFARVRAQPSRTPTTDPLRCRPSPSFKTHVTEDGEDCGLLSLSSMTISFFVRGTKMCADGEMASRNLLLQ